MLLALHYRVMNYLESLESRLKTLELLSFLGNFRSSEIRIPNLLLFFIVNQENNFRICFHFDNNFGEMSSPPLPVPPNKINHSFSSNRTEKTYLQMLTALLQDFRQASQTQTLPVENRTSFQAPHSQSKLTNFTYTPVCSTRSQVRRGGSFNLTTRKVFSYVNG